MFDYQRVTQHSASFFSRCEKTHANVKPIDDDDDDDDDFCLMPNVKPIHNVKPIIY